MGKKTDMSIENSKTEEKYRLEWVLDEYEGNVYICDLENYDLLYVNNRSKQTLVLAGVKPNEIIGKKCYEVIQGRSSPCPFCTNCYLTKDKTYQWEYDNPRLNRKFFIKNRILDWYGRKARIELSHDMLSTEYKLAKKDQEKENVMRTVPGAFFRIDSRDCKTIIWYTPKFLQIIEYTAEQFEEELLSQCSYIHPDDQKKFSDQIQEAINTRKDIITEMRIKTRSDKTKILTITLVYVSAEESLDGIPSLYSVGIDVTEEREEDARQRKSLEEAYQALKIANTAKTNFLSSMSHDIRTPMNAIVGMTALAEAHIDSSEKVMHCLSKIKVASNHLLSLINEVLDMSRIDSGKIDLTPTKVRLSDTIQNISVICRPLALERNHEFIIKIGQVRHEYVVTDAERLQQVLMNFLSNAIKYTPNGGHILLQINELPSLYPKMAWFEFVIKDDGIGMSDEFLPKLFEPFSRAEDSRISKTQGTGLGMAISENIVNMMNGNIFVDSKLGQGTTFTVSLPLRIEENDYVTPEELMGLPILVVDDDQDVCENATVLLTELGMRGYWVLSGVEAIKRVSEAHARSDDFFACIVDWKMPEMDGLETVKQLRKKLGKDVPIIIISAYDYSTIEKDFINARADAFITKPLFKSKILDVLSLFCAKKHRNEKGLKIESNESKLKSKRILLVEDNELNREITTEILKMRGALVDSANDGLEAVNAISKSSINYYDAILMDIQMPIMNGYEATTAIRDLAREDAKKIPIIALTANAFVSDISKTQMVGMNDYIIKPIDINKLTDILEKWMSK